MLEINHVSKSYGKVNALCNFSCKLGEGIYGLLGPNGSGKSTLMNILTDNIGCDGGTILLDGALIRKHDKRFRASIGYMPQYCEMIPEFSCIDFLNYMAVLKGIEHKTIASQIDCLLKKFELDDVKLRKISSFSGGMKQRLMLIQAFLGEPKIVLLDEPTAGLDPKQRIFVKNFISEQSLGKIIVIATHIISDIEHIAHSVICLKKGETVFSGAPSGMAEMAQGMVWSYCGNSDELNEMKENFRIIAISGDGEKTHFRILATSKPLESAIEQKPTIEDAYMLLYGDAQ